MQIHQWARKFPSMQSSSYKAALHHAAILVRSHFAGDNWMLGLRIVGKTGVPSQLHVCLLLSAHIPRSASKICISHIPCTGFTIYKCLPNTTRLEWDSSYAEWCIGQMDCVSARQCGAAGPVQQSLYCKFLWTCISAKTFLWLSRSKRWLVVAQDTQNFFKVTHV